MTTEQLDDLQAELSDLKTTGIEDAIRSGDSCETEEDFVANLDDAIEAAKLLLSELKAIRKQIKE